MASDTARNVTLTMLQRFGLDDLLAGQKGKRDAMSVWHKIRQKIHIPLAERKRLTIVVGQQSGMDIVQAEQCDVITVWLESEEVRKLRKLGDETEILAAHMEWLEPLMEQLEAKVSSSGPTEIREREVS